MALAIDGKLTREEQFAQAAAYAGVPASVLEGMWKVESGRGQNMLSSAGAEGHFQVMPDTRATLEKRAGKKFNPYNFTDGLVMAAELMRENMQAADGDVSTALAMYHGGWDRRNWGPLTASYAGKVTGDTATSVQHSTTDINDLTDRAYAGGENTPKPQPIDRELAHLQQGTVEKGLIELGRNEGAIQTGTVTGAQAGADAVRADMAGTVSVLAQQDASADLGIHGERVSAQLMPGTIAQEEDTLRGENMDATDKFGAFFDSGLTASTMRVIADMGDSAEQAPAGWSYADHMDEYELPSDTAEDRERLRAARSPAEVEKVRADLVREQYAQGIISTLGTGQKLGWGLVAGFGDPMNLAAGFGVGEAFNALGIGVRSALAAGRPVAALARSSAEGVVGAVGTDAALVGMGEHRTSGDFLTDAAFGLALGVGTNVLAARGAAQVHSLANDYVRLRSGLKADALQTARAELGDAEPAVLQRRAEEIFDENERRWREASLQDVPEDDRFFPRPEPEGEVTELPLSGLESVEPEAAPTRSAVTMRAGRVLTAEEKAARKAEAKAAKAAPALGDYVRRQEGSTAWMESQEIRANIESAKSTGEAAPLLEGIASDTGVPDHLRGLAFKLAEIARDTNLQYLGDDILKGAQKKYLGSYFPGVHGMNVKVARPDIVLHEALHGATVHLLTTPMDKLPLDLRPQVHRFNKLWAHVGNAFDAAPDSEANAVVRDLMKNRHGPAKSKVELATYAMTDKTFQKWLATIPAPPGSTAPSAWQWFKDLLSEWLRLDNTDRTALDEALEATGDLVDWANTNKAANADILTAQVSGEAAAAVSPGKPVYNLPGAMTSKERATVDSRYGLKSRISDDAERKLVAHAIRNAERILSKNNVDAARLGTWLKKANLEATSTTLLSSESPVAKALAIVLLENPEGAAGRRATTAAIDRAMRFEEYMGNATRVMAASKQLWMQENKIGGFRGVLDHDTVTSRWNAALTEEMLARQNGKSVATSRAVVEAADALDRSYLRSLTDQRMVGSIGAQRLPEGGESGYFHRVWQGQKIRALDNEGVAAFRYMLKDQLVKSSNMYDEKFLDDLATEMIERFERRTMTSFNQEAHLYSNDTADILRDSLTAMGLNEEEITKNLNRFGRGGAGHTKGRIDLDMLAQYDDGKGGKWRLADFINQDQDALLRQYASRAAGDVALSKYGIQGDAGIKLLRDALRVTGADDKTVRAFDQVMAEFLGRKVGDGDPRILQNIRLLTQATRLGSASFNQMGVYGDAVAVLGPNHVMEAMGAIPRLRSEIQAILDGKPVKNGILDGLEKMGADFGSSDYRIMGLGTIDEHASLSGAEAIGKTTQAIRAVSHGVRVLSGHRLLIGVQTRGMAEQIVQRAWKFIRDGVEDKALADMGIDAGLRARLRETMNDVVEWDEAGNVKVFDPDRAARDYDRDLIAFRNAVVRGAGQILQREFIGETGKWAHDGFLKFLFQFRTFSLVAHQKQLGRLTAVHGAGKAAMIVAAAASFAIPIHLARVASRAALLPDTQREEYLDAQLNPLVMGRQVMNYVAGLGLLPDVLDLGATAAGGWAKTTGVELPEWAKPTGGRGANSGLLGGQFAPGLGLINDTAQGLSGNPRKLRQAIPGGTLPYIVPLLMGAEAQFTEE